MEGTKKARTKGSLYGVGIVNGQSVFFDATSDNRYPDLYMKKVEGGHIEYIGLGTVLYTVCECEKVGGKRFNVHLWLDTRYGIDHP